MVVYPSFQFLRFEGHKSVKEPNSKVGINRFAFGPETTFSETIFSDKLSYQNKTVPRQLNLLPLNPIQNPIALQGHQMNNFSSHVSFIWSIAEILRGNIKQSEYGKVVLPFTVLRRLDCVLEPTKDVVLQQLKDLPSNVDDTMRETMLNMASGHSFHNVSKFTFEKLLDDPENIAANLPHIVDGLSDDARDIFTGRFKFNDTIFRLDKDNLLDLVVQKFVKQTFIQTKFQISRWVTFLEIPNAWQVSPVKYV